MYTQNNKYMYNNDRVTRRYSEPFNLKILFELSTGKYTKNQLGKLYGIAPTTINEWKIITISQQRNCAKTKKSSINAGFFSINYLT